MNKKKKSKAKPKHSNINNYNEDSEDSADNLTDEELQQSFSRGELSEGLHALVPLREVQHINDANAMRHKLTQIKLDYDWIERLDLLSEPNRVSDDVSQEYGDLTIKINRKGKISGEEMSDKAQHDFKREMWFYRHAQSAAIDGIERLRRLSIPTKRPDDYFAEMAKRDDHMKKVRENLANKQTAIEASLNAKKLRQMKKYGKQIQHEVMVNRQKEKKQMLDKLKKFKKGNKEDDELDFLDSVSTTNNRKGKPNNATNKSNQKKNYKQTKYGYGGQKKRSKYNNSKSAADMSSFSRGKHGKPSTNKTKQRPGKSARMKMKHKRK